MIVRLKSTNQAADIITKVESSIPAHMEVHSIKPYVKIKLQVTSFKAKVSSGHLGVIHK